MDDRLQPVGSTSRDARYDLRFSMYFFYTWCTSEWCSLFGRTPKCRDSRVNHLFRNTFPMRDN